MNDAPSCEDHSAPSASFGPKPHVVSFYFLLFSFIFMFVCFILILLCRVIMFEEERQSIHLFVLQMIPFH